MGKKSIRNFTKISNNINKSKELYLLILPSFIIFFMFTYLPMYGVIIAFKDFTPAQGIIGSEWAGTKYFIKYFNSYQFWPTIRNTLVISIYTLAVTFPLPIALALMCNQMKALKFKKVFQVSTYLPHFISTVVMAGMIILFLSPSTGVIAKILGYFGYKLPNLMGEASAFSSIYAWTEVWQHVGWDSIIYIAALSAVPPDLYEAATIDGASKLQKLKYIDFPMLLPTATIMLILRIGRVMTVGFEKVYLLQNGLNASASEIISTYVYKIGLVSSQYSLSSAIGLFNNVINLLLLLTANYITKKLSDTSLV